MGVRRRAYRGADFLRYLLPAIGVLVILLGIQTRRVETWKAEATHIRDNLARIEAAYENNLAVYKVCKDVNAFNAVRRDEEAARADAAEHAIILMAAEYQRELDKIEQGATHVDDTECRTLSDVLPADFLGWLSE